MIFSKLQIHDALLKTLNELGYATPTPVQDKVIPKILGGFDLRVSAPTGTGKTAAFLLPAITRLMKQPSSVKGKGPRVLILVPTRELAIQVASQAKKYSKTLQRMKTVCIYGGVSYHHQNKDLRNHHEIIVATPGRFIDHLEKGRLSLGRLEIFILDEADRMLDMGFSEPVQKIADAIPTKRQTLLFSATLKGNVLEFSRKLLKKNHLEININAEVIYKENLVQRLYYVNDINHKYKILNHLLKGLEIEQAIIFAATKRQVDKLTQTLLEMNYSAAGLHGDMSQQQRTKTITQLRKGKLRILVATDVAARGLDIKTISHVFNFDLPTDTKDYIHRVGRTARAGLIGTTLSFVKPNERGLIPSIEKCTGKKMICDIIPGLEPDKKINIKHPSQKRHSYRDRQRFFSRKKRAKKRK